MNTNMGFKEAFLVNAVTFAFLERGFLCYPQFGFRNGAIDAVFIRRKEIVLTEFKRLDAGSTKSVRSQTRRMLRFSPRDQMSEHQFKPRRWKTSHLWVCDTWDEKSVQWWLGGVTTRRLPAPFDGNWKRGRVDLRRAMLRHGTDWYPYSLLWAYHEK
jgi:hypothetical protein